MSGWMNGWKDRSIDDMEWDIEHLRKREKASPNEVYHLPYFTD